MNGTASSAGHPPVWLCHSKRDRLGERGDDGRVNVSKNCAAALIVVLRNRSRRKRQLGRLGALLDDRALDLERVLGEVGVLGDEQEGIEPAAMVDALERIG